MMPPVITRYLSFQVDLYPIALPVEEATVMLPPFIERGLLPPLTYVVIPYAVFPDTVILPPLIVNGSDSSRPYALDDGDDTVMLPPFMTNVPLRTPLE